MTGLIATPTSSRALIGLDDAGAYLSCSRRHIERMLAAGTLPRVKLGKAVRVAVADLDSYIERLRSGDL